MLTGTRLKKMPHILVTGASGFVGQALCQYLIESGFLLTAASRESTTSVNNAKQVILSETNPLEWHYAFSSVDVVIHLAGRAHVMHENAIHPDDAFKQANVDYALQCARTAVEAGVSRFVYVSSIKVHGENSGKRAFTEADIVNPQDPYARSKWQAEQELVTFLKQTRTELVIVRPPLVYGPGVKANVFSLFTWVNRCLPLPIGGIANARSMVYVGNLVNALVLCAIHPKAANQTYLVSDGGAVSTADFVKSIGNALNKPVYLVRMPESLLRIMAKLMGKLTSLERLTASLLVDDTKMREELGWYPPYTFMQGLRATADWFQTQIQNDQLNLKK